LLLAGGVVTLPRNAGNDDKDDAGDVPLIDESEEEEADARDIIGVKNEEGS
jgi:hypothetical protein